MRRRIHIHDHETLASLARKYPGRSIRWMRDRPAFPGVITPSQETFRHQHLQIAVAARGWHKQA